MPQMSARSSVLVTDSPALWASSAPTTNPASPPRPLTRRTDARARGWPATLGRPAPAPASLPFLPFASPFFFLSLLSAIGSGVSGSDQVSAGFRPRDPHQLEHGTDEPLAIVLVDRLEAQAAAAARVDAHDPGDPLGGGRGVGEADLEADDVADPQVTGVREEHPAARDVDGVRAARRVQRRGVDRHLVGRVDTDELPALNDLGRALGAEAHERRVLEDGLPVQADDAPHRRVLER